ncbi:hypothetical protein DFJ77DRAFT_515096 [Powellomyces hirtus]|nr:hypothetical protein DFJ77DRAFT_515096 [Powellomyces hirtus]
MEAKVMLQTLLERNHRSHNIEYRGYLSNHLVHHLAALYFLGASAKRLQTCYDMHKELEPALPEDETVTPQNWEKFLGERRNFSGLVAHFTREIQASTLSDVLFRYLPPLCPGLHGAALHPLIHLGYACELDDLDIFAEALAYCVFAYLPIGGRGASNGEGSFTALAVLDKAKNDPRLSEEKLFGQIGKGRKLQFQQKLKALVQNGAEAIQEYSGIWKQDVSCPHESLRELIDATTYALAGTYNEPKTSSPLRPPRLDFFLLHGLTSTYAVDCILRHHAMKPLFETHPKIAADLIHAEFMSIFAIYVVQGRPAIDAEKYMERYAGESSSWDEIVRLAVATNDEHATKAVHTLRKWHDAYAGSNRGQFLRAALALTDMIAKPEINDGRDNWDYGGVGWLFSA